MEVSRRRCLRLALAALLSAGLAAPALAQLTVVSESQGLRLSQIDFLLDPGSAVHSDVAEAAVDFAALRSASGIPSGYVNLRTGSDWLVQNLYVPPDLDDPGVSIRFPLSTATGVDVTSLAVRAVYSAAPAAAFPAGATVAFPVHAQVDQTGGKGVLSRSAAPAKPLIKPALGVELPDFRRVAGIVPMVQTAHNQCGPMAVASALQSLEDAGAIVVPHAFVMGLDRAPSDGSLVAEIGIGGPRPNVLTRRNGGAMRDAAALNGLLTYLNANNLQVRVEHMDEGTAGEAAFGNNDVTVGARTSKGRGVKPTFAFIDAAVREGRAVSIGFTRPDNSGHWVVVTAVGRKAGGGQYLRFREDQDQSDDTKGIQSSETEARDTDADGMLNLVDYERTSNVDVVVTEIAQEPVPAAPPLALGFLSLALGLAGWSVLRRGMRGQSA